MANPKLFVKLALDAKEYARDMKAQTQAVKNMEKQTKSLSNNLKNLKRVALTVFVGWGVKNIATSFLDAATEAEGFAVRLNGLLGSVEEGNRLFKNMAEFAGQVPFEYREIMSAATALSGVMRGGVDEISRWMPMIADLAAASGLGIEQTTQQVIRMYSAGAGAADLFRERGVLSMLGFQAGVSYSAEETRKKMVEAWEDPQSKFRGMTEDLAQTWTGTMSMFRDVWFQFRNMVMESGPFKLMKEQAQELLKEVNRLKDEGKLAEWAEKTGKAVVDAMTKIKDTLVDLKNFYDGLPEGTTGAAFAGLLGRILTGSTGIGAFVSALVLLNAQMEKFAKEGQDIEQVYKDIQGMEGINIFDLFGGGGELPDMGDLKTGHGAPQGIGGDLLSAHKNQAEQAATAVRELAEQLRHEAQVFKEVVDANKDTFAIGEEAMNEQLREQLLSRIEMMTQAGLAERELQQEKIEQKREMEQEQWEWEKEMYLTKVALQLQLQEEEAKREAELLKTKQKLWKQTGQGFKALLYQMGQQSETFFRIYQAASIAEATVSGVKSVIYAFEQGMKIGGPPLAAAFAAGAAAFSAAQIAAIASQSPPSAAGAIGGAGAVGTFPASPTTGLPTEFGGEEERRGQVIINIYGDSINDEEYLEKWAEKISELVEDKDIRFISSRAKVAEELA